MYNLFVLSLLVHAHQKGSEVNFQVAISGYYSEIVIDRHQLLNYCVSKNDLIEVEQVKF